MTPPALFLPRPTETGEELFLPSEFSRSVWSLDLVHGAATAALLARTAEQALRPGLRIVRLTVDLMRPVPLQPLAARAIPVRDGKRIQVVQSGLFLPNPDGPNPNEPDVEVGRATALAMWQSELPAEGALQIDAAAPPDPETLETMPTKVRGEGGAYHSSIEWRPVGEWGADGDGQRPMLWIHNPAEIVPGDPLSPVVRAIATSDALSPLANFAPAFADDAIGFINADITLYLHRHSSDDWLCVVATSRQGGDGFAVADGALYDRAGPVGRIALASLAQTERPQGMV